MGNYKRRVLALAPIGALLMVVALLLGFPDMCALPPSDFTPPTTGSAGTSHPLDELIEHLHRALAAIKAALHAMLCGVARFFNLPCP